MGGWIGGQARFVMVPYAYFNLLKFPDRDEALTKICDLTMLTDILAVPKLATSPTLKRRGAMCDCDLLFGHRRLAG